ncbi:MAG: hypothetical protein QXH03_00835 [Candidatus Bathyarchaeia archaeon]
MTLIVNAPGFAVSIDDVVLVANLLFETVAVIAMFVFSGIGCIVKWKMAFPQLSVELYEGEIVPAVAEKVTLDLLALLVRI